MLSDFMNPAEFSRETFRLYLITDDKGRSPVELADRISAAIHGGVTAVQFREKNCGPTLCSRAFQAVWSVCQKAGVPLLLNADLMGRFDLGGISPGIHYSDRTLPGRRNPRYSVAGYSGHSLEDIQKAFSYGMDFCTLSPIFFTPSKAGIRNPTGTEAIEEARERLPEKILIALGGIDLSNAASCMAAGADGIAVIRAIMDADDPSQTASDLRQIVENCAE